MLCAPSPPTPPTPQVWSPIASEVVPGPESAAWLPIPQALIDALAGRYEEPEEKKRGGLLKLPLAMLTMGDLPGTATLFGSLFKRKGGERPTSPEGSRGAWALGVCRVWVDGWVGKREGDALPAARVGRVLCGVSMDCSARRHQRRPPSPVQPSPVLPFHVLPSPILYFTPLLFRYWGWRRGHGWG
jgi:hypothetical protein